MVAKGPSTTRLSNDSLSHMASFGRQQYNCAPFKHLLCIYLSLTLSHCPHRSTFCKNLFGGMGIILLGIEESSFLGKKTTLPSKYAFCLQFSFRFVSFCFFFCHYYAAGRFYSFSSIVPLHFYSPSPDDQRHCNDIAHGVGFLFLWSLQDTQLPPLERDGSCAPDHRTLVSLWPLATEISVPTAGRSFQHLSGHCVARCWELAPCSGHRRLF